MNRDEISQKIIESADRFGASNPQQFKLFCSQLSKFSPEEIFLGLIFVFLQEHQGIKSFQRQELAGRLLAELKPCFQFDLESTIRGILPNYDLSIEQLPYHFAAVHGLANVNSVLDKIESEGLPKKQLRSLQTMRWWLSGSTK